MQQIKGLAIFTYQCFYSYVWDLLVGLTVLNAKFCGQVFGNEPGSSENCGQRAAENDRSESNSI